MTNRKQYELLTPLDASGESYMTLVVAPSHRTTAVDTLLEAVDQIQIDSGDPLHMLGLDGWKTLTAAEQQVLEQ
ncbi:hypothetical protein MoryE10_14810 [Methylogaea oryzae]|uniref:Uncharacterized protein n=2 Tax=Methylogaea oryzae TaxID=1295382 RepID=A0A8D5AM89_9GAMM|nr:hypothetical protein MoryE10_14810 [Methylogaea oryzae]